MIKLIALLLALATGSALAENPITVIVTNKVGIIGFNEGATMVLTNTTVAGVIGGFPTNTFAALSPLTLLISGQSVSYGLNVTTLTNGWQFGSPNAVTNGSPYTVLVGYPSWVTASVTNGLVGSVVGPGHTTSGGAVTFSTNGWTFGTANAVTNGSSYLSLVGYPAWMTGAQVSNNFLTLSGGSITGNLVVANNGTYGGNLVVAGNFTVSGITSQSQTFVVSTTTNNFITTTNNTTVTVLIGTNYVDVGGGTNYQFTLISTNVVNIGATTNYYQTIIQTNLLSPFINGATGTTYVAGDQVFVNTAVVTTQGTIRASHFTDNKFPGNLVATGTWDWVGANWSNPPTNGWGMMGATGATGANGINGTNGLDGATGATGATGPAGATGATGSAGVLSVGQTNTSAGLLYLSGTTLLGGTNQTGGVYLDPYITNGQVNVNIQVVDATANSQPVTLAQARDLVGGIVVKFASTNSTFVAGYYDALANPPTHPQALISVVNPTNTQVLGQWISQTNNANPITIRSGFGTIIGRQRISSIAGNRSMSVAPTVSVLLNGTTEVLLTTPVLAVALTDVLTDVQTLPYFSTNTVFNPATDRMIVRWIASAVSGSFTYTFSCGSNVLGVAASVPIVGSSYTAGDAPMDGRLYGRQNGNWVDNIATNGGTSGGGGWSIQSNGVTVASNITNVNVTAGAGLTRTITSNEPGNVTMDLQINGNVVVTNGATSTLYGNGTATVSNQYVVLSQLQSYLGSTYYGATNANIAFAPAIRTNYGSFFPQIPAGTWTNTYSVAAGTISAGNRFMTNTIAGGVTLTGQIEHDIFLSTTGGGAGVFYEQLALVSTNGTTTNIIYTAVGQTPVTAAGVYQFYFPTTNYVTQVAGGPWVIGILRNWTRTSGTAVLNIIGGGSSPTSITFPSSIGSPLVLGTAFTNTGDSAGIVSGSGSVWGIGTNVGSGITNNQTGVTLNGGTVAITNGIAQWKSVTYSLTTNSTVFAFDLSPFTNAVGPITLDFYSFYDLTASGSQTYNRFRFGDFLDGNAASGFGYNHVFYRATAANFVPSSIQVAVTNAANGAWYVAYAVRTSSVTTANGSLGAIWSMKLSSIVGSNVHGDTLLSGVSIDGNNVFTSWGWGEYKTNAICTFTNANIFSSSGAPISNCAIIKASAIIRQ